MITLIKVLNLGLFLSAFIFGGKLQALQIHPLLDQHQTILSISKKELNRIALQGEKIHQIFGAEEALDVQSDETGAQIFVRCLGSSKTTTLTLITESGLTHDVTLEPQNIPFQSIVFKPASLETSAPSAISAPLRDSGTRTSGACVPSASQTSSSLDGLKGAMNSWGTLEGYTLSKLKVTDRNFILPFKLSPQLLYQGDTWEGRIYRLENTSDRPVSFEAAHFALPQDQWLSLGAYTLPPKGYTFLKIISRRLS